MAPDSVRRAILLVQVVAGAHAQCDHLQLWDQGLREGRAGRRGIATLRDNEVAGAHAQCDRLQFVQLSETMKSQELTPNVIAYNLVINACAIGVPAVTASRLFETMKSQELTPNVIAYKFGDQGLLKWRAGRCGIAALRDDEVAGAHAQCDRLQCGDRCWREGRAGRCGLATLRADDVAGAHAQCDRLRFGYQCLHEWRAKHYGIITKNDLHSFNAGNRRHQKRLTQFQRQQLHSVGRGTTDV